MVRTIKVVVIGSSSTGKVSSFGLLEMRQVLIIFWQTSLRTQVLSSPF